MTGFRISRTISLLTLGATLAFAGAADAGDGATAYIIGDSDNAVAGSPFTAGSNPKQVAIDLSEKLLLVTNEDRDDMSIFKINQKTGVPTQVSGSPFPINVGPRESSLPGE